MSTKNIYWNSKTFSSLAGVSIRALRHYEALGLLKPMRNPDNGYRLYSEADLLMCQQILSLKFFGLKLKGISHLLLSDKNPVEVLTLQESLLDQQIASLQNAKTCLKDLLKDYTNNKSIDWEKTLLLIEVYNMMNELKNTWAESLLSTDELKQYAKIRSRFSDTELQDLKTKWNAISEKITANIHKAPETAIGKELCEAMRELTDAVYQENTELRSTLWQGVKNQKAGDEFSLSPEQVAWIDKAMAAHY